MLFQIHAQAPESQGSELLTRQLGVAWLFPRPNQQCPRGGVGYLSIDLRGALGVLFLSLIFDSGLFLGRLLSDQFQIIL